MGFSFGPAITTLAARRLPGARSFRMLADTREQMRPPQGHSLFVIFRDEAQRRVAECNQRTVLYLAQPILQIGNDWRGHEQGPEDFEQRWPLDGLHVSPEMAVVVPQVAVPPSARPRLNFHGQR